MKNKTQIFPLSSQKIFLGLLSGLALTLSSAPLTWAGIKTEVKVRGDVTTYLKPTLLISVRAGEESSTADNRYKLQLQGAVPPAVMRVLDQVEKLPRSQTLTQKSLNFVTGVSSFSIGCSRTALPECGLGYRFEIRASPNNPLNANDRAEAQEFIKQLESCISGFKLGLHNTIELEDSSIACGTKNINVP